MSVTTTDNARVTSLRHALADYDLHHSQLTPESSAPAPSPNSLQTPTPATNPPDWETHWRRVPAYRPVDPSLILGDRDHVNSEIERNFIRVMFGGVWLQAAASWVCRKTIGRWNEGIFRIRVGGEW